MAEFCRRREVGYGTMAEWPRSARLTLGSTQIRRPVRAGRKRTSACGAVAENGFDAGRRNTGFRHAFPSGGAMLDEGVLKLTGEAGHL